MSVRLEAAGITCAYGDRVVLSDFSLRAESGKVIALLGPNGAGKTTALRALARLLRPQRGSVRLDGRDIWSLPQRSFARRIAFLSQADDVSWSLTVEQVVTLGRIPHRGWVLPYTAADRAVIGRTLERLCLESLRDRPLDTLSGGERRRAMLARALAQEAEILLLDEPTTYLDLRHQVELLELLRSLARERGLAVIASFHDLNQAALHADEATLLRAGHLLAHGETVTVLHQAGIRTAYGIDLEVLAHPAHGGPIVLPVRHGGGGNH
ncbi:MAG TPA: ABC transporter ATP-binding protein [Thermoanaerobaculia bacterium]